MKFAIARLAATAFATVSLVASASAADRVVNVYNWSDYIDSSILDDFTKETGIKVVYDTSIPTRPGNQASGRRHRL